MVGGEQRNLSGSCTIIERCGWNATVPTRSPERRATTLSENRREFVKKAGLAARLTVGPAVRPAWGRSSPNDRINVAVVGFHRRGRVHYRYFAKMPGVNVSHLCDIDEGLFPNAVSEVEHIGGYRPATDYEFRNLLEKKDKGRWTRIRRIGHFRLLS